MIASVTQAMPLPLRIAARKAKRKLHDASARFRSRTHAPPLYRGKALGWAIEGTTLEVELFREPCNEIGTTALDELELLADFVRRGANGARAILF
ncbi:MAG: hypothetical protein H5U40_03295, partial [Polyangiaceae bacterium]|nr:hypothetical protein [Polyangiaceae bacterium]